MFKEKGVVIPENKREEFLERIEKLFQAGGMMDLDQITLHIMELLEEADEIRDPKMKEAGDVLFVPDEPEYKNEGIFFLDTQPKRRLCKTWEFTPAEKKNNKARVTFRRYMALVANKELRKEVFGF